MKVYVGIRTGITMKFGQASIHRQSNDPLKAICGKALSQSSIRPLRDADYDQRCRQCFDKRLGGDSGARPLFGLSPRPSRLALARAARREESRKSALHMERYRRGGR